MAIKTKEDYKTVLDVVLNQQISLNRIVRNASHRSAAIRATISELERTAIREATEGKKVAEKAKEIK